jgi:SAM-dependent methyltransferase
MVTTTTSLLVYGLMAHLYSYHFKKHKIVKKQKWDLNICCGKTDGGGVNVDIVEHKKLPNFTLIDDIYTLPFQAKEFNTVLCSHTLEHVDDPRGLFNELDRVGEKVTVVLPPLYDFFAAFNILEHKVLFLTFKKEHHTLPPYIKLPLAETLHKRLGQRNKA